MNRKPTSRLADLPHRVREQLAKLPDRWQTWREGFRQDPTALWRTPVIRVSALVFLAGAAVAGFSWLLVLLTPTAPGDRAPEKRTLQTTLHVACANPACRTSYTTSQAVNFKAWPLKCEKCGQLTVYRATCCPDCKRWFAVPPGRPTRCPFCPEKKPAKPVAPPTTRKSTNPDDEEDHW